MEGRLPALAARDMSRDGHTIRGPHGSIRIEGDALAALVVAAAERGRRRARAPAAARARRVASPTAARGRARARRPLRDGAAGRRPRGAGERRRGARATRPASPATRSTSRSRSSTVTRRPPPGAADGALPPLPVGSDRAAADGAVRGRAGRVRARARRGGLGAGRGARPPDHGERPRAGPPTGSVRSSGTSCGSGSTSWRRRACRPRWR